MITNYCFQYEGMEYSFTIRVDWNLNFIKCNHPLFTSMWGDGEISIQDFEKLRNSPVSRYAPIFTAMFHSVGTQES